MVTSGWWASTSRVSQGLILGPVLFKVFIYCLDAVSAIALSCLCLGFGLVQLFFQNNKVLNHI